MGFKVAPRPVFGRGAYQVKRPGAGGTSTPTPPATFLAFALGRRIGNWRR